MRCSICGAVCTCSKAAGGICCSCHPHKKRVSSAMIKGIESEGADDPHAQRWAEIERERARALPQMRDV